jgi:ribose 5-phosphate isomerase B
MRYLVGSDHAGVGMRQALAAHLAGRGLAVEEIGPAREDERADYPDAARAVARAVAADPAARGVLVCGTGIGMSIAANKVRGVRAALVHDPLTARLAAEHNAANVLCLGGRLLANAYAVACLEAWLAASFEGRHQVRIDKIAAIETRGG